jgi:serine/threonine-protein kinase
MSLAPGTRLGLYQILAPLGAGGMGEVYRAHDTKLGREVAIKVLPSGFPREPERLARFEREARLLASLNHPNVATLHGLEQFDDTHFLVMELVSGETLRERISKSPIRVREAIPLFQQLAEALEEAHEKGIIHRDLKPANIKITEDGKVKVLDFGLAKAFSEEVPPVDLSHSPTITRQGTETGVVLGTAAYMSPEQARGKALDKRTDIWSFGCVLYESLTGQAPFLGATVSDTMVRILDREPDWDALPDDTPPFIRLLLHRCLQKDAKDRLHDIADARIEIRDASSDPFRAISTGELATVARSPSVWRQALPWALAGLLTVIAAVSIWIAWRPRAPEPQVSRSVTTLPPGQAIPNVGSFGSTVALSADGSQLVYVAQEGNTRQLYRRAMDSFEAEPIPGTERALAPFLSPDGRWIGFYANREVKKVALQGGALSTICGLEQTTFRGGSWGGNNDIVYSHCQFGLKTVSAAGGTPEVFTSVVDIQDEKQHVFPQILPGGAAVLFTLWNSPEDSRIAVRHLGTGEQRTVIEPGTHARYVPTGHIVYAWKGELLAAPFDLERLAVAGLPVRVLDNVLMEGDPMAAHFSISDNGSLVYVPGGVVQEERTLVWVDRNGNAEPLPFPPGESTVRVSPNGKQVVVSRWGTRESGYDLWIYELERGVERRLSGAEGDEWFAVWTPDGRRVVCNSARGRSMNLYWKPVDGSGPEELFVESENKLQPFSWSADGNLFAYQEFNMSTDDIDIWVLPLDGGREPHPLLHTEYKEVLPDFSPDGQWLAYVSNESGRWEVNVRPYPGPGAVIQVSTDGGWEPLWSPDGREVYYRVRGGDQMMAVSFFSDEPSSRVGKPRLLFEGTYFATPFPWGRMYDISPDGKRFLMIQESEPPPPPTQYNIVLNWFDELKRLVPADSN